MKLKQYLHYIWPILGITLMFFSARMIYHDFHNPHNQLSHLSLNDLMIKLHQIPMKNWVGAITCTIVAYASLAGYDHIGLEHLKRKISWWFIALCSFSAYALSHSIGASVLSGAAIRYRAYTTKGLNGSEVAVLVAFCSFTFVLGVIILLTLLLLFEPNVCLLIQPHLENLLGQHISHKYTVLIGFCIGVFLLLLILMYIFGSWMQLPPLKIGNHVPLFYPKLPIVAKQLIIGPLELLASSGIIYFMLPSSPFISYHLVMAAFLAAFTLGLLSNAPGGGLGVFEVSFMALFPTINPSDLLLALIIFRVLYIVIPLITSIILVGIFELNQYKKAKS